MEIEIQLTREPIAEKISPSPSGAQGAWLEFRGVVRGEENGAKISALEYEAYSEMATREIRRLMEEISSRHPCLAAKIIHRIGTIPAGETAIYVGVASSHRAEAIALLAEFMDKLKQDVPIWKNRALPLVGDEVTSLKVTKKQPANLPGAKSLDAALAEISSHCQLLPATRLSLEQSLGHILRETVLAPADLPDADRSTRDGYAILENDVSETFQIVDTLHAADWKPRQLKSGEAVRVATGATLPCEHLRVVMQENIERNGDKIRITKPDGDLNIRQRGQEVKAGAPLVQAGTYLDAGKLALLASAGCVQPLVSSRVRVVHFTTGDEVIPPDQTPKPGQIRDSNSILIHSLLKQFPCELFQGHLREDFETAKNQIKGHQSRVEDADVILISGGVSVGDKDFTRPLLESLGYQIVFSQIAIRPGKPTIFGVNGRRVAFGLPGNPLAHFVCFHLFVATALAKLSGGEPKRFLRGRLAAKLDDVNSRETLWPSRWEISGGQARLHPLPWSSSGDLTCLTEANVLVRVPPNSPAMDAGAEIDFLPTEIDY
jgi:molybdopterin molybdotransferase